jgi:hypothetical protein
MFVDLKPWQSWQGFFFHSYECQGLQTKNQFEEILSISFDLGPPKVHMNT